MGDFEVKPNKLSSLPDSMQKEYSDIIGIRDAVGSISNDLGFEMQVKSNIRRRLFTVADAMLSEANSLKLMQNGLINVINLYDRTENKIISHAGGSVVGASNWINNIGTPQTDGIAYIPKKKFEPPQNYKFEWMGSWGLLNFAEEIGLFNGWEWDSDAHEGSASLYKEKSHLSFINDDIFSADVDASLLKFTAGGNTQFGINSDYIGHDVNGHFKLTLAEIIGMTSIAGGLITADGSLNLGVISGEVIDTRQLVKDGKLSPRVHQSIDIGAKGAELTGSGKYGDENLKNGSDVGGIFGALNAHAEVDMGYDATTNTFSKGMQASANAYIGEGNIAKTYEVFGVVINASIDAGYGPSIGAAGGYSVGANGVSGRIMAKPILGGADVRVSVDWSQTKVGEGLNQLFDTVEDIVSAPIAFFPDLI